MASLFNVLGSLGSQYGEAKEQIRTDKQKADMLAAQLGSMKTSDELARQQLSMAKTKAGQVGWDKAVTFIGAGGKKYQYNPVTSEIRDYQMPEGAIPEDSPEYKVQEIERGMGRKLTDEERTVLLNPAMATFMKTQEPSYSAHVDRVVPGDTRPHRFAYDPKHPEKEIDKGPVYERPYHPPGAEAPALPESRLRAMANMWQKDAVKPPAKYQAQVEDFMENNNMRPKTKLSNNDQKNVELIKQISPKIDHALKQIEDAGLQNSDNYIFGANSVLARRLQMGRYAAGHTPSSDKRISDIIRSAAALKVMGVAPWTQLGRGKYLYQDITVHLPDPHDTPKQLYEKLQFLKGVIEDAQGSLPEGPMDFGVQRGPHSNVNADPLNLGLAR
jgi:hypothetical protein